MEWTPRDVHKLINSYRRFECLWNFRSPSYKCLDQKRNSWAQISKEIGKDVNEIKRKMKHLRTAYVAEKKKVDASRKSSPDDLYESNLFYYDELRFLDSFIVLRKTDNYIANDSQEELRKQLNMPDCHAKREDEEDFQEECHSPIAFVQAAPLAHAKNNPISIASQSIHSYSQPPVSPSPTTSISSAQQEEMFITSRKRSKRHKNGNSKLNAAIDTILRSVTTPESENIYTYFTKCLALQLQQLPIQDATETMNEIHTLVTKKLLKSMSVRNGRDIGDMVQIEMKYE